MDARDAITAALVAQAMSDDRSFTAQPGWAGGLFDPMGSRSHMTFDESPDYDFAPSVTPQMFGEPDRGAPLANPPGTFDPLAPYDDSAVPAAPTDIPVSPMPEFDPDNMPSAPTDQDASLGAPSGMGMGGMGAVAGMGDLGLGDFGGFGGSADADNTGGSSGVG